MSKHKAVFIAALAAVIIGGCSESGTSLRAQRDPRSTVTSSLVAAESTTTSTTVDYVALRRMHESGAASRNGGFPKGTTPPRHIPPPTASGGVPLTGNDYGVFRATCYQLRGHTRTGTTVSDQTIAVDPNVIPLGTWVYVEGIGKRHAEDTGGAIKGHVIDVWRSNCAGWANPHVHVYKL